MVYPTVTDSGIFNAKCETETATGIRMRVVTTSSELLEFSTGTDCLLISTSYFEGQYTVDHQAVTRSAIGSNQIFWSPSDHHLQLRSDLSGMELIAIEMPSEMRLTFLCEDEQAEQLRSPHNVRVHAGRIGILAAMVRSFVSSAGFGGCLIAEAICNMALNELVLNVEAQTDCGNVENCLTRPQLDMVIQFIDTHRAEKISQDELADLVGLSVFHFSRLFKASTGLPPHKFVIERRLLKSKKLLADGDHCIAEIAYQSGFSSQSHLTDTFRRVFYTTPAQFRRETSAAYQN